MGRHPLADTVAAFEQLQRDGKILTWGVSNLGVADLEALSRVTELATCVTDQVLYNLGRRGPELDLFPMLEGAGMPAMAYSPIEQGRLLRGPSARTLGDVARRHDATPAQVALAWTMRSGAVLSIPKAGSVEHQQENLGALRVELGQQDFAELDQAFPAPTDPVPLEML